ncbi:MAG: NUDIX hydrolase [Ruminococcaceae bacterium]|nr:NUDIX hydrolase [Oscillospiraceae bacterium]
MEKEFQRGRVQALVVRGNKILLVRHCLDGEEYWVLPGGGREPYETPEEGALRELKEECGVDGVLVRKTSEYYLGYDKYNAGCYWTYLIDIGAQEPVLGYDPELSESEQVLRAVEWKALDELSERDRAWLWSAGLISVPQFGEELNSWSREVSPTKKIN